MNPDIDRIVRPLIDSAAPAPADILEWYEQELRRYKAEIANVLDLAATNALEVARLTIANGKLDRRVKRYRLAAGWLLVAVLVGATYWTLVNGEVILWPR